MYFHWVCRSHLRFMLRLTNDTQGNWLADVCACASHGEVPVNIPFVSICNKMLMRWRISCFKVGRSLTGSEVVPLPKTPMVILLVFFPWPGVPVFSLARNLLTEFTSNTKDNNNNDIFPLHTITSARHTMISQVLQNTHLLSYILEYTSMNGRTTVLSKQGRC